MKRRLFGALICGILISVLTLSAFADTTDYAVGQLGLTVSMPSEYSNILRRRSSRCAKLTRRRTGPVTPSSF